MTPRDRNMLLVIVSAVLLGALYMFVIKPQQAAVKDVEAQVTAAKQSLSAAQQQASSGRAAQDAYRRDRATIIKIGRVVPETDDIATLQVQLSDLAKKEQVYFTEFTLTGDGGSSTGASSSVTTPSGATDGKGSTAAVAPLYPPGSMQMSGGLGRTPITIGLKGTYFSLERYLRAVQRFAVISASRQDTKGRLLVVDGFGYEGADQVSLFAGNKKKALASTMVLDATLNASVYFAPPLAAPSSGGAGGASPTTPSAAGAAAQPATGAATVGGIQ